MGARRSEGTTAELDRPVWAALHGPHRGFASGRGAAVRYDPAVTPFAAVADAADPSAWADLAAITLSDTVALFATGPDRVPPGWALEAHLECLQLTETERLRPPRERGADVVDLGTDDVPEMLALVERTQPGPFLPRTVELGGYVGVRDPSGRLVAMAGRRLATGSWREVSAVCTDPAFRGRGLARRLIEVVVADARVEGERVLLHVTDGNPALGLYEAMGFAVRRRLDIVVVRRDD